MGWLITLGVIALIFGVLLLFSKEVLPALGAVLNKPVAYIDEKLRAIRILTGIVLVIIGGWVISVAFSYPELWYLHLIGVIALFFGFLYLFLPEWLAWLSKVSDQVLLSTDEIILGARKSVGIILILVAIYVFYSLYLITK